MSSELFTIFGFTHKLFYEETIAEAMVDEFTNFISLTNIYKVIPSPLHKSERFCVVYPNKVRVIYKESDENILETFNKKIDDIEEKYKEHRFLINSFTIDVSLEKMVDNITKNINPKFVYKDYFMNNLYLYIVHKEHDHSKEFFNLSIIRKNNE